MSTGNPVVANVVVGPIDRTAPTPSISFGGDQINNSGTGIRGDISSITASVAGSDAISMNSTSVTISKAVLATPNTVCLIQNAGAPTNGVTGAGVAGPGSICVDYTNANLYVNAGTIGTPSWKLVTRAA